MTDSKTPQFDKALDAILSGLVPHARVCIQASVSKHCEKNFEITDEDIRFLKMLRVPPPKCCPTCRRQRRFAFVNRCVFYKRKNDAPGGARQIVSYIPPSSPFVVYDYDYYRSGKWDAVSYGVPYDFSKPFFEQFFCLRLLVPQPAILKDPSNINYEYSLSGKNSKNVYCSSGITDSENVWYTIFATKIFSTMDSHRAVNVSSCYGILFTENSSNCNFSFFSKDCVDSSFLYDCRNCTDCFGCVNLRSKRYCFFNEQLTSEGYEQKVKEFELHKRSVQKSVLERFWKFVKLNPVLASRSSRAIDCDGVLLLDCKNCKHCVSAERAQNERYVDSVTGHKDSMDVYASSGISELLYETTGSGFDTANSKFLVICKIVTHSEYLINCRNCQFCFGCIGLENKKYCIFNTQYEPEEYFAQLDSIKSAMLRDGEYGEFFPYKFSPFAYNGSDVDFVYPLGEEDVWKLDALWQEDIETDFSGLNVLQSGGVPDSILDVGDDILTYALVCEETGRPFRIVPSELEFYRRHSLPLPAVHPYKRMKNMFAHVGSHRMYKARCESCGENIKTIYAPNHGWRLYCESCFQEKVV